MHSTYELVINDDAGMTTIVPLGQAEVSIGRKTGNFIKLTERNVSRHHARLVRAGESLGIEDLGSYTGVRVNGRRITGQATIDEGDQVQIGEYNLALRRVAVAVARPRNDRVIAEATHLLPTIPLVVNTAAPLVVNTAAPLVANPVAPQAVPAVQKAPRAAGSRFLGITMGVGVIVFLCGIISYHQIAVTEKQDKGVPPLRAVRTAAPQDKVVRTVVAPTTHAPLPSQTAEPPPVSAPTKRQRRSEQAPKRITQAAPVAAPQAAENTLTEEQEGQLLDKAQDHYVSGRFTESIRVARLLKTSHGAATTKAWRILGAAACKLGDLKLIDEAYRHVDVVSRQYMLYVCQNAGVTQSAGHFLLAR